MNQLAKRHDLEAERPGVAAELTLRYARQKRNLNIMYWLAALLGAGTIIVVLLERNIRQRAVFKSRMQQQLEAKRIRTSISRDLHDDVGSTIGALSVGLELLKSNLAGDADRAFVQDLQQVCREATVALRESISMTRKETVMLHDFVSSMRERVLFILGPDRVEFIQDGRMADRKIPLSMERNMMLIFKEILHNHQKHSRANKLHIRVGTTKTNAFFIEASDQGVGFDMDRKEEGHWGMETMEERAKEIGADLEIQSAAGEGTTVRLTVPSESFDRKDTLK
jgi:signal transduction histidine kinase